MLLYGTRSDDRKMARDGFRTILAALGPGFASEIPFPMMIEASEPGGVNCTTRKSSPEA